MLTNQYDSDRNVIADDDETGGVVSTRHVDYKCNAKDMDADDDNLAAPLEETQHHPNNRLSEHAPGEEESSLASADDENDEWIAHETPTQMTTNEMANNARRTNVITTFCQYIKANLNRMTDEQIDRVIEDMTVMLFRRKRAFRRSCDARF